MTNEQLVDSIAHAATELDGSAQDYNALVEEIGNARVVLIGEASHGTHEFYRERARLTRRLISEKNFNAVAIEADWPDSYKINRYVQGEGNALSAVDALSGFQRFPTWMWRNTDVVEFIGWLRDFNDSLPTNQSKIGFYGLDLYSLNTSVNEVIRILDMLDPEAADEARHRYSCLDVAGADMQQYGYLAYRNLIQGCEDEVVKQLLTLYHDTWDRLAKDSPLREEQLFNARQNARLVKNAEAYYRSMFRGPVASWNQRDRHMFETLETLINYYEKRLKQAPKIIIWAHNSHIGDATHTEMSRRGELNIGQLCRQQFGMSSWHVGFTTHTGTVTAASNWDAVAERKTVQPSRRDSFENIFHQTGIPDFMLNLRNNKPLQEKLDSRLERAIGVIYRPETERISHYFLAAIGQQFDTVIHFDKTHALEPLEITATWHGGDLPETYPSTV